MQDSRCVEGRVIIAEQGVLTSQAGSSNVISAAIMSRDQTKIWEKERRFGCIRLDSSEAVH